MSDPLTPQPTVDRYAASFLVLLATIFLTVAVPWCQRTYVAPVLERRRLAAVDATAARTAADVIEAARRAAVAEAASVTTAKALAAKAERDAKATAEADARLRALRGGMQSYYATDNARDIGWRNDADVEARRVDALRRYEAAQRELTDEELARRAAAADVQDEVWSAEVAARAVALAERNEGAAVVRPPPPRAPTPPLAPPPPATRAVTAAAAGARPAPAPVAPAPPPPPPPAARAPRKRALADDELAAARRDVAALRVPPEPPAGAPGAVTLVIDALDFRGSHRLTRRFAGSDPLRALLDAVQAGVPGGMAGRQLEARHPRAVLVSWRDYALRELRFDAEFAALGAALRRQRAEREGGGGGGGDAGGGTAGGGAAAAADGSFGGDDDSDAPGATAASTARASGASVGGGSSGGGGVGGAGGAVAPAPVARALGADTPRELVTLADAGLTGRCALILRPIEATDGAAAGGL